MESAFGRRFGDVRIHADRRAGEVAQALDANAFTAGRDIVFAPGAFAPGTDAGRRLIAHELAHVAQGNRGPAIRRQTKPAPGPASGPAPSPATEVVRAPLSTAESFKAVDTAISELIGKVQTGVDNVPVRYSVKFAIDHMRKVSLPGLRAMHARAQKLAAEAQATSDESAAKAAFAKAGGVYHGTVAAASVMVLQANLLIVSGFADQAGVPTGTIANNLDQFRARMLPVMEAVVTEDTVKIRDAMKKAEPDFEKTQAALLKAISDIQGGQALSRKVIGAADLLLIAFNFYQVLKTPTIPGGSGGSGTAPAIGNVYAGGVATMGVSAERLRELAEAIQRLVSLGALDPAIIGTVGATAGGTASPVPELGKPTVMQASTPSKPSGKGSGAKTSGPLTGKDVVKQGSEPLTPGKGQVGQYGIDTYGSFNYKGSADFPARTGDKLAGHEMLQNLWLEAKGFGKRLTTAAARDNPAIGLTQAEHIEVGRQQAALGLHDRAKVAKMTAAENIELNAQAMRKAKIPEHAIQALQTEALKYAATLKPL